MEFANFEYDEYGCMVAPQDLAKLQREFDAMAATYEEMEHCIEDYKRALFDARADFARIQRELIQANNYIDKLQDDIVVEKIQNAPELTATSIDPNNIF